MVKFNLNQLLNEKSKSEAGQESNKHPKQVFNPVMISVYDLVPSKDNFYSMGQIQDLKIAIELAGGVKQNLNVTPLENGKYKIIAGHRRQLASIELVEEGKQEYEFVPCSIEAAEKDTELQEIRDEIMLIVTNSQRDKTDWDKVEEVKRLRTVLERYKKSAKVPGRLRDLIAQALNTSPAQIGRMEAITNNLMPEFKEELKEGHVNLSSAYELSGLPEEQQKKAFEEFKEKGTVSIKDAKEKKQEVKQPESKGCPMNNNLPLTEAEVKRFCDKGCSPSCGEELGELLQKKNEKQLKKQPSLTGEKTEPKETQEQPLLPISPENHPKQKTSEEITLSKRIEAAIDYYMGLYAEAGIPKDIYELTVTALNHYKNLPEQEGLKCIYLEKYSNLVKNQLKKMIVITVMERVIWLLVNVKYIDSAQFVKVQVNFKKTDYVNYAKQ
jgi:ParB-like chromosome segregation protein Spo0J